MFHVSTFSYTEISFKALVDQALNMHKLFVDKETGNKWNFDAKAIDGENEEPIANVSTIRYRVLVQLGHFPS